MSYSMYLLTPLFNSQNKFKHEIIMTSSFSGPFKRTIPHHFKDTHHNDALKLMLMFISTNFSKPKNMI